MGIRKDVKLTKFFNEFGQDNSVFECKRDKFLPNIDTFYYSVFFKGDNTESKMFENLFLKLDILKALAKEKKESQSFDDEHLLTMRSYAIYQYCITKQDLYDIFISDYLPNDSTPRVVVQIRSYGLWLLGTDKMIDDSFEAVKNIFSSFDVEIEKTRENRIDYCYHTNYIQEPYTFFSDNKIRRKMKTTLDMYQKLGHINKNSITLDYFALGQRKSNNLFVRTYNKSREVIEEGYKSFFFAIWLDKGLINQYDMFCYQYAFINKTYNSLDTARLLYYVKYGKNDYIKACINNLLKDLNVQYEEILQLANAIMPKITLIMNIEFQTKRKFYYNATMLQNMPVKIEHKNVLLQSLYTILDNRKVILDYITDVSLSFGRCVDENKIVHYDSWWERLRNVNLDCIISDFEYIREFNYKCDKEKINKRVINAMASNSVYNNKKDSAFIEDVSDWLGVLNDNDTCRMVLGNFSTGEVLDNCQSDLLKDYKLKKEKKYKVVKNRLPISQ